jgi:hypothetical protein
MSRKFHCFRTHHEETKPPHNDDAMGHHSPSSQDLDHFRERGQDTLRRLIYERDSDEVDWMAVIRKANELHAQEQQWLQKQDLQQHIQSGNKDVALKERRRVDASGSFSANMQIKRRSHHKKKSTRSPITSYFKLDDGSCSTSDSSAHKSWDAGSLYTVNEC